MTILPLWFRYHILRQFSSLGRVKRLPQEKPGIGSRIVQKEFFLISDDYREYISELGDQSKTELRYNFEILWDSLWDKS